MGPYAIMHRQVVRTVAILVTFETLTAGLTIDYSNMNHATVPDNINPAVIELLLQKNQIPEVDSASFPQLTQLEILELHQNGLKFIRDGTFDNNIRLNYIKLNLNDILQMPSSFGGASASLDVIRLWGAFATEFSLSSPWLTTVPSFNRFKPRGKHAGLFYFCFGTPNCLISKSELLRLAGVP